MSEISFISRKYTKISQLTDDINTASVSLKKHALVSEPKTRKKYPGIEVPEHVYIESKEILMSFLRALVELISNEKTESDISMLMENKVYQKQFTRNPGIRKDFHAILKRLENDQLLSNDQFRLLDKVLGVLDNERSYLFRKMRNIAV